MKTPIPDYLDEVLDDLRPDSSGAVADYIPELAAADPDLFAVAITTAEGSTYVAGDADAVFSIQSISKPFAYAAALIDRGFDRVLDTIGVEPSGEAFNELSLEGETHRPKNPMINAGAIATHALVGVEDADPAARMERVRAFFSQLAGRELGIDHTVHHSEFATADRNLAIGHMLRNYGVIDGDVRALVDGYVQQCSIEVNVRDLSVMAATLASGGVQPISGHRLMTPAIARQVMAVMAAAGMYDGAGDWLTRVGIPAKSGVSGGMVGVLPDQVGIGVVSPRLDRHGNSQRGKKVFQRLSRDMDMHLFSSSDYHPSSVHEHRSQAEEVTFSLHGIVQFTAAAELLDLMAAAGEVSRVVLDVSGVFAFTDVGRRMSLEGLRRLRGDGVDVALRDPGAVLPDPDLGDGTRPRRIE